LGDNASGVIRNFKLDAMDLPLSPGAGMKPMADFRVPGDFAFFEQLPLYSDT